MDDSDDDLGPVYDFTPEGVEAQHAPARERCDGWSAYARWLMQLKAQYRRPPKASDANVSPARSTDKLGVVQSQRP
ncbi:MAG: hypothetical protein AAFX85_08365 [Pseudomonadota bacterium]